MSTNLQMPKPPTLIAPPFTVETATLKVRLAEDAWNLRDPVRVALAYTENSVWRNRSEFVVGREQIRKFLAGKWDRELDYRLVKALWAFTDSRIAVRFQYEWQRTCAGAMAPQLRQRTVGIRRTWPDATPRGQHQRCSDSRNRSQVFLARSRSSTSRPPRHP